tara:strand:- start:748 stop:945 length:198 start_codon:yes stop_codon:yes gene_type:complete
MDISDSLIQFKLVVINAHSLFSKWFSESGKQVQKMFELIRYNYVQDEDVFTCLLIGSPLFKNSSI